MEFDNSALKSFYYLIQAHTTLRPGAQFRAILKDAGIEEIDPPSQTRLDAYMKDIFTMETTNISKNIRQNLAGSPAVAVMSGGDPLGDIYNFLKNVLKKRNARLIIYMAVFILSLVFQLLLVQRRQLPVCVVVGESFGQVIETNQERIDQGDFIILGSQRILMLLTWGLGLAVGAVGPSIDLLWEMHENRGANRFETYSIPSINYALPAPEPIRLNELTWEIPKNRRKLYSNEYSPLVASPNALLQQYLRAQIDLSQKLTSLERQMRQHSARTNTTSENQVTRLQSEVRDIRCNVAKKQKALLSWVPEMINVVDIPSIGEVPFPKGRRDLITNQLFEDGDKVVFLDNYPETKLYPVLVDSLQAHIAYQLFQNAPLEYPKLKVPIQPGKVVVYTIRIRPGGGKRKSKRTRKHTRKH